MPKEEVWLIEDSLVAPCVRFCGVVGVDRVGGCDKTGTDSEDCLVGEKLVRIFL